MKSFLKSDLSNFHDIFQAPPSGTGLFITFEGIEGSGKTTQIQKLESHFNATGRPVLRLREPGGTPFGEKLREAILNQKVPLDPMAETALFVSSRAQLLNEQILPFLKNSNHVVIVDRYIDSTLVYQGSARGKQTSPLWAMHQFAPLNTLPHLTFFLDIDVDTSMSRQASRGHDKDYFESRQRDFHQSLADGYRQLAKDFPERIQKIDASSDETQVSTLIEQILKSKGHL